MMTKRDELIALDPAGLEAAVRECARITAPEISDVEYERIKAGNSPRYQNTRAEMERTLRAYLTAARSDAPGEVEAPAAGDGEPVAWIDFAENDNIRLWTSEKRRADAEMALGRKMTPVYTAPPADAGMREALDTAFCAMKDLRDGLHREPLVQGRKWVHLGSSLNDAIRKAELALTAPGATTKSDGGVEGHADSAETPTAETAFSARPVKRVGAGIKPGPSDPSSTRSEVTALADIAKERQRQREVEGWTPEHDDAHVSAELAMAGACYALASFLNTEHALNTTFTRYWPWDRKWWKPKTPRKNLVRAGALIVAEIERLDRLDQFEIRRK